MSNMASPSIQEEDYMPCTYFSTTLMAILTVSRGSFQKYDFGLAQNIEFYGTEIPSAYNLSNIRNNIHLVHGTHNNMAQDGIKLSNFFR